MNAPTNGGYHELFVNTGGAEIYVDHNKTGHILWKIVPENGVYRIKVIDEDKLYGVAAKVACMLIHTLRWVKARPRWIR